MRKFVLSKSSEKKSKRLGQGQGAPGPDVSNELPERDVHFASTANAESRLVCELREKLDVFELENTKLKEVADRLLDENVTLKVDSLFTEFT